MRLAGIAFYSTFLGYFIEFCAHKIHFLNSVFVALPLVTILCIYSCTIVITPLGMQLPVLLTVPVAAYTRVLTLGALQCDHQ